MKRKIPSGQDIKDFFIQLPIVRQVIVWSKTHSLPGFLNVPIYDVIIFLFNEIRRYDLFMRANSVAFSFFLSLFPSLIALFTMLPFIKRWFIQYLPGGEEFDFWLRKQINEIMPGVAGDRLFQFIDEITNQPRFGLLSFGFLLAIFFSSNGMQALMRGFEKSYSKTFHERGFLKKRLIAIFLTFQLGALLIASVILIILGEILIDLLADLTGLKEFYQNLILFLRWIVILALFYFNIAIIYRYGPPLIRKFKIFTPGATLATVLCVISSVGFSYYVDSTRTYNELYGAIGTIIVLMLWIQINSLILLIGFELNASIAINRDLKVQIPDEEVVEAGR